jgi:hypothetical protein
MSLYSWRWTVTRGWHWKYERDVTPETQVGWLARFSEDEPDVIFRLDRRLPTKPPKGYA